MARAGRRPRPGSQDWGAMRKLGVLVAALAVALLAVAGGAVAASGAGAAGDAATAGAPPRFEWCVGGGGACGRPPAGSLDGVAALAVAPGGHHLYASAFGADTVSSFTIGNDGRPRFRGCVADATASVEGCATAPAGTLRGPAGLAVGRGTLFVTSERSSTVSRLDLYGGIPPTFRNCLAATRGLCTSGEQASLRGATAVALGPGGRDLYVASSEGGALTRLRSGGGALRPAGCLAYAGAFGCGRARKNSLVGADAIAVAPNGRAAYAVAFSSAAVTELGRSSSGALSYRGCVGDRGPADCRPLHRGTLTGAAGIAVSPDGREVYVASQVGTVTRFAVTASGRLAFSGCIGDGGVAGCAPVPGRVLAGATGIVVAPDGRTLYVAAKGSNAIVVLSTDGGAPRFLGCVRAGGGHGCTAAPAASLGGAYAVAAGAGGGSLYTGATATGAVAAFALR